jgi:hypothetical protein
MAIVDPVTHRVYVIAPQDDRDAVLVFAARDGGKGRERRLDRPAGGAIGQLVAHI